MKEPKIDEKTRDYLKKWGRREVPTAQVQGGTIAPGMHQGFAAVGWIERRQGIMPFVGVHFMVLTKNTQEPKPLGTLSLGLPVTKTTELLVNSFLHYLGWDGRVWPFDEDGGWPTESKLDAAQIRIMLSRVSPPVGSTLTFPSDPEKGMKVVPIPVFKRHSPYPWAPFEPVPEEEGAPAVHLARFRELCQDPYQFAVQN